MSLPSSLFKINWSYSHHYVTGIYNNRRNWRHVIMWFLSLNTYPILHTSTTSCTWKRTSRIQILKFEIHELYIEQKCRKTFHPDTFWFFFFDDVTEVMMTSIHFFGSNSFCWKCSFVIFIALVKDTSLLNCSCLSSAYE